MGLDKIFLEDYIEFLRFSNYQHSNKKSFVIVVNEVDLDQIPDETVIVPTIKEAYDIIEMEGIERDLGL